MGKLFDSAVAVSYSFDERQANRGIKWQFFMVIVLRHNCTQSKYSYLTWLSLTIQQSLNLLIQVKTQADPTEEIGLPVCVRECQATI